MFVCVCVCVNALASNICFFVSFPTKSIFTSNRAASIDFHNKIKNVDAIETIYCRRFFFFLGLSIAFSSAYSMINCWFVIFIFIRVLNRIFHSIDCNNTMAIYRARRGQLFTFQYRWRTIVNRWTMVCRMVRLDAILDSNIDQVGSVSFILFYFIFGWWWLFDCYYIIAFAMTNDAKHRHNTPTIVNWT